MSGKVTYLNLDEDERPKKEFRIMRRGKTARDRASGALQNYLANKAYRKDIHHLEKDFGKGGGKPSPWANGRAERPNLFPDG